LTGLVATQKYWAGGESRETGEDFSSERDPEGDYRTKARGGVGEKGKKEAPQRAAFNG